MGRALRSVLVGCGQIADGHVGEVQKLDTGEMVAVCDLEILMAEQLARRFGIGAWYDDFDAMLERHHPDVVHIATPPASHLALARKALDAGCHVYMEKPFALTYAEAVEIVERAERAGKKLTIGHNAHFDPPALELRRLIADGVIGDPVHVESWFGYNLDGPFGRVLLGSADHWVHRLPGKLFQNNINHMLHKITELLPDERPEIRAMGWSRRKGTFGDARDDFLDELRVMIRGEEVSAYGTFSAAARPMAVFARVYGTKNTVHLDYTSRTVTLEQGPTKPAAIGRLSMGFEQAYRYAASSARNAMSFLRSDYHYFAGLNRLIAAFYDSILEDGPVPIPYRDILRIAWMMDEIFAQIGTGGAQ